VSFAHVPQPREFEATDPSNGACAVAAWERHNAEQLIELQCRVPEGTHFLGREINLQLEQVSLARVLGTAHEVAREPTTIAERPADAIAVYAGLRGDALVDYAGSRRVIHPGEIMVCDVDQPFVRGFGHGLEELAVRVPRQAFVALTGLPSLTTPLVVDSRTDVYARALVRLIGRAVAASTPVAPEEQSVVELVSVLASGVRAGVPHAHRAAARAYIDDHLTDPSLSASHVAAGAGISERHLSRVFGDAGTSVPRQILNRRLDLAYSLLAHAAAPRTADVAARCGFASMAYFSQAFRRRFGVTAGEVRRSSESTADAS
jgi:AraC-like DNA-binding protein